MGLVSWTILYGTNPVLAGPLFLCIIFTQKLTQQRYLDTVNAVLLDVCRLNLELAVLG